MFKGLVTGNFPLDHFLKNKNEHNFLSTVSFARNNSKLITGIIGQRFPRMFEAKQSSLTVSRLVGEPIKCVRLTLVENSD